jgi:hypothetical protein
MGIVPFVEHTLTVSPVSSVANRPRSGVSLASRRERREYIDVLSLHRQSLQNKQCFHNLYAYPSAARNIKHLPTVCICHVAEANAWLCQPNIIPGQAAGHPGARSAW